MLQNSSVELVIVDGDMETDLLNLAEESLKEYKFQYLTAATFPTDGSILAWFNGQPLHAPPLSLNLLHNAMIKALFGEQFSINVINAPFKSDAKSYGSTGFDGFVIMFPIFVGIVMSILSPSYISFYIKVKKFIIKWNLYH